MKITELELVKGAWRHKKVHHNVDESYLLRLRYERSCKAEHECEFPFRECSGGFVAIIEHDDVLRL